MTSSEADLGSILLEWFAANKRDLPWRKTKDPYKIWLSEVIMQQTQIIQGTRYYLKFVEKYPKIEGLANASEEEVFKLWEGLGYYSRARNMHLSAKLISKELNGVFPEKYEEIIALKGIGRYTAAAICSIAYGSRFAVVDGNVIRLISRLKGIKEPANLALIKKKIENYVLDLMSDNPPGIFNESIMEFGALICKPKRPLCDICILKESCYAYEKNIVLQLPVKRNKIKIKTRFFYYNVIYTSKGVLINKREKKDIWRGLYEFPLIEEDHKNLSIKELKKRLQKSTKLMLKQLGVGNSYEQKLTHQKVLSKFYFWQAIEPLFDANKMHNFVRLKDLNKKAFPKTIIWFLDENTIHLNNFYN